MTARMDVRYLCLAIVFLATGTRAPAISFVFDYNYDSAGFFSGANTNCRSTLEAAASFFETYLTDDLLVLDATTDRPLPGATVEIQSLALEESADASGVAALRGLATGRFTVRAAARGYAPARKEVFPSGSRGAVDRLTLALLPGALLAGTVVTPSGARVAGATEIGRAHV